MLKMQPVFINNKEKIARIAYGGVGVGKKLLYTGGFVAAGSAIGYAVDASRYTLKKISEKAAKKILEKALRQY